MRKMRYAVIGTGFRSQYYIKLGKLFPDTFELTGMLFRNPQKAETFRPLYEIPMVFSMAEIFAGKPDFIVVAVDWAHNAQVITQCMEAGVPVLAETPPAKDEEELRQLWEKIRRCGGKVQVAEQYFLYPSYLAKKRLLDGGYLGSIETMSLSALHGYHGASMIRKFLNTGFERAEIKGNTFEFQTVETDSRDGWITDGRLGKRQRTRLEFLFESGKRAFFDFTDLQYRTRIRTRHMSVQGVRGELDDDMLQYVNPQNQVICGTLQYEKRESQAADRINRHIGTDGALKQIVLPAGIERIAYRGQVLYEKPWEDFVLPEEETAIALCMWGMKNYLESGTEFYPLREAFWDAYLSVLMTKAAEGGEVIQTVRQPWCE